MNKQRAALLAQMETKLEIIRTALKTYKETEVKVDIKGKESDYAFFAKAKVGLDIFTPEEWKTQFEWIGGAYQHNVNMDLRIGTNRLEADFKEDHLEICREDFDEDMELDYIKPAFENLKKRKLPIFKKLISLSQEQNVQFSAVKLWILTFGLRASVCATELIYGIASIFNGIEDEPKKIEVISIYKNFDDWVKKIAKLRVN